MALLVILLVGAAAFLVITVFQSSNWWREKKAREEAEAVRADLLATDTSNIPTTTEFGERFATVVAELAGREESSDLIVRLASVAAQLYADENFTVDLSLPPPIRYDSYEGAKYLMALRAQRHKLTDRPTLEFFAQTVFEMLFPVLHALPASSGNGLTFPVAIDTAIEDVPGVVRGMIAPCLGKPASDRKLFERLAEQLRQNLYDASGLTYRGRLDFADRLVPPDKYKGPRLVQTYLRGTPLLDALDSSVDFAIPEESRFEHMHIVAGTGHGKTQTLQRFILHDLSTEAGLVIIDSQGEMLRKVAQLRTAKEVIYIDPTDLEHPPSLNMFDVSRLEGLPAVKREQFLNGLIELLEYVFAGLLRAELTQKQNVLFRYTLRLMLAVPGATLVDLLKCLAEPAPYLGHARSLNPMAREFLEREYLDRSYTQTREQIRRRLYGVLENDAFRRMFSSSHSSIDVAAALNRGAVLLVDTAKSHLKSEASGLMGRYFIALTLQAALEREGNQRKAFLYIDEAGEYFDDNIDSLLNEARKRRVGIVMAHQYLDQLTPQLRSSIATNTAIKMAGGISDKDARALAGDMRTSSDMIAAQRKGHFMCYVKNVTPAAVSIHVPFGELEALPKQPFRISAPPIFAAAPGEQGGQSEVPETPPTAPTEESPPKPSSEQNPTVDTSPTSDW